MADPPKNFRSAFGPLGDLLGFPLRQVDERWRASLGARLAPLGITVSRAVALFFVEHNPGCSQAQLGAALHVNRPSTARAVDDLVAVGAVERSKAGGNARTAWRAGRACSAFRSWAQSPSPPTKLRAMTYRGASTPCSPRSRN